MVTTLNITFMTGDTVPNQSFVIHNPVLGLTTATVQPLLQAIMDSSVGVVRYPYLSVKSVRYLTTNPL